MPQLEFTPAVSVSRAQLDEWGQFLRGTIRTAGQATLAYFRQGPVVENKRQDGSFDPVTAADKEAERIIRSAVETHYPTHGVYGEEFGFESGNGLTWVIDPVDGTRAFMTGMLHWGVLVALFDGQEPVLGAMYQPFVDELFIGYGGAAYYSHGGGAEVVLRTSSCTSVENAAVAITGPDWFSDGNHDQFERLKAAAKMVRYGGDCYLHAMVAMGTVDVGTDVSLNPYDIQALIPIVRGAGGVVTTYAGENPSLGGDVVCCANATLHADVLRVIEAKSG